MGVGTEFVGPVTMTRARNFRSRYEKGNSNLPPPGVSELYFPAPVSATVHSFGRSINGETSPAATPSVMTREDKARNVDRILQNVPKAPSNTMMPKANAQRMQAERKRKTATTGGGLSLTGSGRSLREGAERSRSGSTFVQFGPPKQINPRLGKEQKHSLEVDLSQIYESVAPTSRTSEPKTNVIQKGPPPVAARPRLEFSNPLNNDWVDTNAKHFEGEIDSINDTIGNGIKSNIRDLDIEKRIRSDYGQRFEEMRGAHQNEIAGVRENFGSEIGKLRSMIEGGFRSAEEADETYEAEKTSKRKAKAEQKETEREDLSHTLQGLQTQLSGIKKQKEIDLSTKRQRQAEKVKQREAEQAENKKALDDRFTKVDKSISSVDKTATEAHRRAFYVTSDLRDFQKALETTRSSETAAKEIRKQEKLKQIAESKKALADRFRNVESESVRRHSEALKYTENVTFNKLHDFAQGLTTEKEAQRSVDEQRFRTLEAKIKKERHKRRDELNNVFEVGVDINSPYFDNLPDDDPKVIKYKRQNKHYGEFGNFSDGMDDRFRKLEEDVKRKDIEIEKFSSELQKTRSELEKSNTSSGPDIAELKK